MTNLSTHKQLNRVFADIAARHKFINSFGWGNDSEIGASTTVVYPLLFVQLQTARMIKGESDGTYKTIEMNFTIKMLDLVQKDKSNELDIESDTFQILTEVVNEFNNHPYFQNSNLLIIGDIDLEPLNEFSDDEATGWSTDLTFKIVNNNQFCGLPFEPLTGTTY